VSCLLLCGLKVPGSAQVMQESVILEAVGSLAAAVTMLLIPPMSQGTLLGTPPWVVNQHRVSLLS